MQLCSFSASSLLFLSSRVTDPGKKKIRPREKTFSPHHSETYSPRETCWFVVKIDQKYMHPSTCTGFLDESIAKIFKISTICIIRFNFFKTSKFNFIPFLFIPLDRQLFSRLLHISKSFSSRCNYALSLPPFFLSSRVTDPGKKKIRRAKKLSLPVTAIRKTCWFVVKINEKYMYPSTCTGFLDEKIAKIFKISTICIIRFNFFKTSKFNFIPFLSLDRQLFSRLFHLYPLLSNLHIQTFFIDIHRYRD